MSEVIVVLGVRLANLGVAEAVARGIDGGLVLAPSGPGLCEVAHDSHYRDALLASDLNLTDSGFVLLVRLFRGHRLATRTSGLGYLRQLLAHPSLRRPNASLWVMPSRDATARNLHWLNANGIPVTSSNCYVAPAYPRQGVVEDAELLALLEERRPPHVFVCVGSGVQEKLGLFLKQGLTYSPGIHCIGAAIAFLSGDQASIAPWVDRIGMGWLARCLREPRVFVPRYLRAFELAYLVLRYDEDAPPLTPRGEATSSATAR